MIYLGSQFIFSVLSPYIQSYFQISDEATWLMRPISNTIFMPFVILGSHLTQNNMNPRLQLLIGGCIGVFGCFASGYTDSYPAFIVLFPMLFGICGGMTYVVPMNIAWQYFPGREGLITGIIDSSFGMGGAMFGHLMSRMINPEHIEAWEENEMHPYPFEENIA